MGAATGDVRPAVENLELVVSSLCTVVDRSVVGGRLGKVVRMFGRSVRTWSLEGEGARCVVSWGSILICWSLGGRVAGSSLSSSRGLNWLGLDWLGRGGLGLDWLGRAWLGLGGGGRDRGGVSSTICCREAGAGRLFSLTSSFLMTLLEGPRETAFWLRVTWLRLVAGLGLKPSSWLTGPLSKPDLLMSPRSASP